MDQTNSQDSYVFARNYKASARLDLQHHLWRSQVNYLLHPSIPLSLSSPALRVADVGTGTGTWLLDLARQLPPTAQLQGFDIDISQCPPKSWLPPNVTMRALDALEDLAADLVGKFDIVHVRLFMFVVEEPTLLLRNVVRMLSMLAMPLSLALASLALSLLWKSRLEPDGWLQWEEYDNETAHTIKAHPGADSSAFDALFQKFAALSRKTKPLWVKTLHKDCEQQGLVDVNVFHHATSLERLPSMTDLFMMGWEELIGMVKDEEKAAELKNLFPRAVAETRRGLGYDMDRVTVVAKKGAS
ncbi:hypothetical protein IMSHALPRED_001381 [Imshaugia aleurites]|uniref:Methyltransferase domain-containing protein n=1 Tax=Imshaugia aleurites TaxID=172621 RepID=A0A8H3EXR6_9LECA|nr:hypothetical protein IMSHALPRED_001381 [Imshaugia aleurites]